MFRGGIVLTLSKNYRQRLYDICYRIKANVEVPLDDRIWMTKLADHNKSAKGIVEQLLCPEFIDEYPQ